MPSQSTLPNTYTTNQDPQSVSIQEHKTPVLSETDSSRTVKPNLITASSQGKTIKLSVRLAAQKLSDAVHTRFCSSVCNTPSQSTRRLPTEAQDRARDSWEKRHDDFKQQVALHSVCLDFTKQISKDIKKDITWKGQSSTKILGAQAVEKAEESLKFHKDSMAYLIKHRRKAGFCPVNSSYALSLPSDTIRDTVERNFSNVSYVAKKKESISSEDRADYMSGVKQLLKERFPDTMAET